MAIFLAAQVAQFRRREMFLEANDLGLGHGGGFFFGGLRGEGGSI